MTIITSVTAWIELLWDFKIQTDSKTEHKKLDIVVLDKIERKWPWLLILLVHLTSSKTKSELPKLEEEVETDLRIAQKKPWCQS